MNKLVAIIFVLIVIAGYVTNESTVLGGDIMKVLTIKWRRLVAENGQTCDRCGGTEKEIQKALRSLKQSLTPLGIEVTLEKKALSPAECAKDISQSNRIWIGGRPLEEWLNAQVGKSPCGFCCADLGNNIECRTVEIEGQVYETIPAELIVKAGLLAASRLITVGPTELCCEKETLIKIPPSSCCPKSDSELKECR